MANIKKYIVEHEPTMGSITVEIDFDYTFNYSDTEVWNMDRIIREMVDFWTGGKERVAENDGSYVNAYLIQLCELCFEFEDDMGLKKLIDDIGDEEGYFRVDGSEGIKLLECTRPNFGNQSDYSITVI